MRRPAAWAALCGLLLVAACSPSEMGLTGSKGACNATLAQFAVDQPGVSELRDRAARAAGAGSARFLKSSEIHTLEPDPHRLILELDETNKVTGVRCG